MKVRIGRKATSDLPKSTGGITHVVDVHTVHIEPIVLDRRQLLRIADVKKLTGLAESTIYARMAQGTFPLARKLGEQAVGWIAGEVLDWIEALPTAELRKPRAAGQGRARDSNTS